MRVSIGGRLVTFRMAAVALWPMGRAGVKDAGERADLLAWLKAASQVPTACRVRR